MKTKRVGISGRRQRLRQEPLAVTAPRQIGRSAREIGLRRDQVQVRKARRPGELARRRPVQEIAARRAVRTLAQAGGCVCLGIEIDQQDSLSGLREAGSEVHCSRRLADATLLVGDGVNAPGHAGHSSQARGRFRATPGRRGKPAGVGRILGTTARPACCSGGPPPSCSATRASCSRSAEGPSQRTAAPPGRTSVSAHSSATGGEASALASATPKRSVLLLLRAAADDGHVREAGRRALEKVRLARVRLQQRHLTVGKSGGDRDPG